jgi:acetyl-CoA carboxylase biotin carboxyl carrier protein
MDPAARTGCAPAHQLRHADEVLGRELVTADSTSVVSGISWYVCMHHDESRRPSRPPDYLPAVIGYRGDNTRGSHMADEIRAEMVANVWKVAKAAGDAVEEGDTLVILESMKMEIPVLAESDGVLRELAVGEGDVVQEGDLIAVIE